MNILKKIVITATFPALFGFNGLIYAHTPTAQSDNARANPANIEIVAHLKQKIGPAEAMLLYSDSLIASISIHGVRTNTVSWLVNDDVLTCNEFEAEQTKLQVKANGRLIAVEMFDCHTR